MLAGESGRKGMAPAAATRHQRSPDGARPVRAVWRTKNHAMRPKCRVAAAIWHRLSNQYIALITQSVRACHPTQRWECRMAPCHPRHAAQARLAAAGVGWRPPVPCSGIHYITPSAEICRAAIEETTLRPF